MSRPLSSDDLQHILDNTRDVWDELRGNRIFMTGATGFIGTWLLESFAYANDRLGLGATTVCLTRDPAAFRQRAPHLSARNDIAMVRGDVRDFAFPSGAFSHVIHAATASGVAIPPLEMLDTIVLGTRRTLEFAVNAKAGKFLLTGSGAVYGRQPSDLTHVPETFLGAPDLSAPASAYGEGKRVAELLCELYRRKHGIETKVARCFAFVGPHLPLDAHFAVGNFIRDGLEGDEIRVKGDGTANRSYLYAADLMIWLWTILMQGRPGGAYNVGSEQGLSIGELAKVVADAFRPAPPIVIERAQTPGKSHERYVPATRKARTELGLVQRIDLPAAVKRTIAWHRT
jgi:nucleoside-diphosphate-sugar epimerase